VLALAFHVGTDRFALGCAEVVEVIPRIVLRSVPHAPVFMPGLFTYRGAIVPVVDLCQLIRRAPCPERLSSRIIVVKPSGSSDRLLGLLAERVLETIELDPKTMIRGGIEVPEAPYLGEVFIESGVTTQQLKLAGLVHGPLRGMLQGEGT
jgi:chemotaxis-related protein WspB